MPVFQYSTASALMAGVAAQGLPVSEVVSHGQFGLGTVVKMDGEIVIADGTAYHLCASGQPAVLPADAQLPFAMVADFERERTHTWPGLSSKDNLVEQLRTAEPGNENRFILFRAHGTFDRITARVVSGQNYTGQPLGELGDSQRVYEIKNVTGQLVGFVTPAYLAGISIAGLHAHFLSDDKQQGGHVLDVFSLKGITASTCVISEFDMRVPESSEFSTADLSVDRDALNRVEG